MKVTFIATVYNEEETIYALLKSINEQSKLPDEIVFVDGGSTDKTVNLIEQFEFVNAIKQVKIVVKKGNISVGRNEAIRLASHTIIASSDAGCILDKNWIKYITHPFTDPFVQVVAGYYKGIADNAFQKALLPYVLVMPDKVNEKNFLPASRSMAFRKEIIKQAGGFPENLDFSEDYYLANKFKKMEVNIVFSRKAIVSWIPKKSLKEAFIMFERFAYFDTKAAVTRPKAIFVLLRYFLGSILLIVSTTSTNTTMFTILAISVASYIVWAIAKNYKYVKEWKAIYYLPILQFTADAAVIKGTITGFFSRVTQ